MSILHDGQILLICNFFYNLQADIENLQVYVNFIMDGTTTVYKEIIPYPDPVFLDIDVHRVDNYITVWPCKDDRIAIQVNQIR